MDEAEDGPNHGGQVIGVAAMFMVLSWLAVTLRMYCRVFLVRSVGMDDWTMLALLVIFTVYLSLQMYGATRGIGFRDSQMTEADRVISLKVCYSPTASPRSEHG